MATHSSYSCLENSMDRRAWWATDHGFAKSGTNEHTHTLIPYHTLIPTYPLGFPHGSVVKNLQANARDMGSNPGSRRSPGKENGNSLQYFLPGKSHIEDPVSLQSMGITKESDMT